MKKQIRQIISFSMALCLVAGSPLGAASQAPIASAQEVAGTQTLEEYKIKNVAIESDTWENVAGIPAETFAVVTGAAIKPKLHIKASAKNKNGIKEAAFINKTALAFTTGKVEVTLKTLSDPAKSRTGIHVKYDPNGNGGKGTGIFVGYDPAGWFWQQDGVDGTWYQGERVPVPAKGEESVLGLDLQADDKLAVTLNGEELFKDVDTSMCTGGAIAIKAAAWGTDMTEIEVTDLSFPERVVAKYEVTGTVKSKGGNILSGATVKLGTDTLTTGVDGTFKVSKTSGTYTLEASAEGYKKTAQEIIVADGALAVGDISLNAVVTDTLNSGVMTAMIDQEFPRVIRYQLDGKSFEGQNEILNEIKINRVFTKESGNTTTTGFAVVPTLTYEKAADGKSVVYHMAIDVTGQAEEEDNVKATFDAHLSVEKNVLTFNIDNIKVTRGILRTIEIENHNLVSVNSGQAGADIEGTQYLSTNTHISGDYGYDVTDEMNVLTEAKKGYMYAFVSNDSLSAGLWSNSENKVNSDWQRVTATAKETVVSGAKVKAVGLSSTYWTYQKSADHRQEDGTIEYTDQTGKTIGGTVPNAVDELPCAKVVITADANKDTEIDWQDGAIAYRDIMNNPFRSEMVPDLAAYRINMTFGSQAQNPFLMALDNVKKVYLNTDGLGQSVLLKGYGSEGHDSGHLNYADIGTRIGGAEDLKILLEKGDEYGATFGIHVNASETYPESKYFNDDILKRNADGTFSYGWNWIDQGININADYDLRHGRVTRWKELYDALGGAENKLDFVYVDVWGNGQSGDNGSWASRQVAKEIISHGWRLGAEWGHAFENDATFQHWAADLGYGGFKNKGINSTVERFIRNQQKDSWVANLTNYGGAADAPLLGGMNMRDFEGWQGRSDYASYIYYLYEVNVATKFLQHFNVIDWVEGQPVEMEDNGSVYNWTPDMKTTLTNDIQGKEHTVTVERASNTYDKAAENNDAYRTRTMKIDGREILNGMEDDSRYLLPWYWDAKGNEFEVEKLYHWNTKGGTTTWDVPAGWTGNVKMYRLDELGKQDEKVVPIVEGKVTLEAKEKTPYVLYLDGKVIPAVKKVTWSDGMHIVDSGFNSGSLNDWTIEGDKESASIAHSQGSNPMLSIANPKSEVTLTQTLTGLEKNTKYAAYVGIDNRSEKKAEIRVTANGETVKNAGGISIAKNYIGAYAHNTREDVATIDDKSYFQNMYVFFETGSDGAATFAIAREGGAGITYFDDIRFTKNDYDNWEEWDAGIFTQDFENSVQGAYPFVLGNLEGPTDNRTHLSEMHAPYTQRGWDVKKLDDVIGGKWALKTNGLSGSGYAGNLVYQTIPQNFTFEAGQSYMVEFDYEAGTDGIYAFVSGNGDVEEKENAIEMTSPLLGTAGKDSKHKTASFNVVGNANGLTWIGIMSTGEEPKDGFVFEGYGDVVIDNLKIVKTNANKEKLWKAIETVDTFVEEFYTPESYAVMKNAQTKGMKIYQKTYATQNETDAAEAALTKAIAEIKEVNATKEFVAAYITKCEGMFVKESYSHDGWFTYLAELNYAKSAVEKSEAPAVLKRAYRDLVLAGKALAKDKGPDKATVEGEISSDNFIVTVGSAQDSSADGDSLIDNNTDTLWHTDWAGTARANMWVDFALKVPEKINGLRQLPRQSGSNGVISDYDIQISRDNGASYTSIKKGTFEKGIAWHDVSFELQSEVTNVRLYALTTVGDFASAAEMRIMGPVKQEQAVPSGMTTKSAATTATKDGAIMGVDTTMQYSNNAINDFIVCTGTEVTGLAAGNYYIRKGGNKDFKPSDAVKVVVFADKEEPVNPPVDPGSGGSGNPDIPKTPEKPMDPKKDGWDAIDKVVSEKENGTVKIDMTEDKVLPSDTLTEVKGKDVVLEAKTGDVTWRINGKNVADASKNITLEVVTISQKEESKERSQINSILKKQAGVVKEEKISQLGQFEVKQEGKLPFRATLKVPVESGATKVFISFYNEKTKKLEIVGYKQVKNNEVVFVPENGGRYIVTDACPVKPAIKAKSEVKSGDRTKVEAIDIIKGKATVTYKVSDKSKAAISKNGSLLTKKKGTVKVTMTVKQAGKTYTITKIIKVN